MKTTENCELFKNQIYTTHIQGYSSEGHGVCRINERAVFVPGTIRGEGWRVKILKVTKSVAYGKAEELLLEAAARISPDCPVYPRCGGCALRHMSYDEECSFKRTRVNDALARIGGLSLEVEEIRGAREITEYRNKAIYALGNGENGVVNGYFRARSHDIIPVSRCLLVPESADAATQAVLDWMRENRVPAYNEQRCSGLVRHVFVRAAQDGSVLLCLVSAGEIPNSYALVEAVRSAVPGLTGVVLNINKTRGNTVLAGRFKKLWGNDFVFERLCGLEFRLSPASFFQINTEQAQVLYDLAREFAEPADKNVLDLYCGTGTIGLSMAREARRITGAEIVEEAVKDARENARRNGIENAEFILGDALDCARELAARGERPDVIIVDPPRKGLAPGVCEAIAEMSPERVVYVSCDPGTLARDLKIFTGLGYETRRTVAVDMFPRTAHVETVVLLSKLKSTTSIEVKIDLDEMDLTKSESKATYAEIKAYVLEQTGLKVSQLYIAQVKRKHGIIERENYNTGEGKAKVPQVPEDKEKAIEGALKYFKMI